MSSNSKKVDSFHLRLFLSRGQTVLAERAEIITQNLAYYKDDRTSLRFNFYRAPGVGTLVGTFVFIGLSTRISARGNILLFRAQAHRTFILPSGFPATCREKCSRAAPRTEKSAKPAQ
jgi:hypothetical protein